jgi:hypothetical protein
MKKESMKLLSSHIGKYQYCHTQPSFSFSSPSPIFPLLDINRHSHLTGSSSSYTRIFFTTSMYVLLPRIRPPILLVHPLVILITISIPSTIVIIVQPSKNPSCTIVSSGLKPRLITTPSPRPLEKTSNLNFIP